MNYKIYLCGEIHSNWREEIKSACKNADLPLTFYQPETNHDLSDDRGDEIIGKASDGFIKDQQSAGVNSIRIRTGIKNTDMVIVRFGEKYRQWNTAFEAGYAAALGKPLIIIHPEEFNHALKDIDVAAQAVVRENSQVVELLKYLCR